MFKHAPLFALLLLAAGCARDDSSSVATGRDGNTVPAARSVMAGRFASPAAVHLQPTVGAGHAFASLPDRGNLVGYPARPVVRRDGAYTWHRAELSEQHAIRAIATGVMRIKAPSGQELEFRYDRHEEYPNGDWSWVGHLIDGSQADDVVITFGAKAAFGTIAQPAGKAPLRLTIQNGVSWLVETDRAGIAAIHNSATDPKRPDYLVPPKAAAPVQARAGGSTGMRASAAPAMTAATAVGNPLVDLVVGYTPGFASGLGGDSQAQTRLYNMVAITNEAYVNSQVSGRVRLVKTVLVNYPDATSNDTALEQLTGFKAPSTRTTPAAAFSALRAARDQYGADLVSLVRKFNDPENDGCGIAWLIGGSNTGNGSIHASDEFFGYSVVSDGFDGNYGCRDETLAHELGHNMGAQHDRATATENGKVSYGVFPYSFGYKTTSAAGNFYSVMAYGDQGQFNNRIFSNPRVAICGPSTRGTHMPIGALPCGAADADNARTLGQTMVLVAEFRATKVAPAPQQPPTADLNGDGSSDLLWLGPTGDVFEAWQMAGTQLRTANGFTLPAGYRIMTSGDFNGDGRLDLLLTSSARDMVMWWGNGQGFSAQSMGRTYGADWRAVGQVDFNGDGVSDLLWRNDLTGQFETWTLNGVALVSAKGFQLPAGYRIETVGDFNGDGLADLFITSAARDMVMWFGTNGSFSGQAMNRTYGAGWRAVGQHDFNGDGKSDLLWRNDAGQFEVWLMDGASLAAARGFALPAGYRIVDAGDYNADGKADLFLTSSARDMVMWFGDGSSFAGQSLNRGYGVGWGLLPTLETVPQPSTADLNGDGSSDLLWLGPMGDVFEAWQMAGTQLRTANGFTLPAGYRIMTSGDFNGDGRLDLLLTSSARDMVMWWGNGQGFSAQSMGRTYGADWRAVGQVDFNGDGVSDLLWRNDLTGQFETWTLNGVALVSAKGFQLPAGYRIETVGDFNGDGLADLFITSAARDMVMWFGTNGSFSGQAMNRTYGAGWRAVGQHDFNGDGKSDLLWRNDAGQFEVWLMDGASLAAARGFALPAGYRIVDAGDYNADGKADLFLTSSARDMVMWFGDGSSFAGQSLNRGYGVGWGLAANTFAF